MKHERARREPTYEAPWGRALIVSSALVVVLLGGLSAGGLWVTMVKHQPILIRLATLLPLALVAACLPFVVRGYTVTPDSILVHRLFWDTYLPRIGLQTACVEPNAMRGSIRTFGNGGGFSFTGLYYNGRLRTYRAFVTDLHRTVVLRYSSRTVVLSPAAPEAFVRELAVPASP